MTDEYIFPIINIFASVLIFPNPLFAEGKKISWELAVMIFRGYKAGINDAPMTPFTAYMNISWRTTKAQIKQKMSSSVVPRIGEEAEAWGLGNC